MTLGVCPPGVAAGQPMPVNMTYFGGAVQVNPKIYLVYWGWGEAGAFDHTGQSATDPDGVGALMSVSSPPSAGLPGQYRDSVLSVQQ